MNPIHYQASELWQNLVDQDTGAIYQKAIQKTVQIFKQLSRFLLLLLLLVTAVVVWAWSIGFQGGSGFRIWLKENPDPSALALKTVEVLLYPFRVASIWLEQQAKELFGWDLKLTELLPAEPQTQMASSGEKPIAQGNATTASISDSVKSE